MKKTKQKNASNVMGTRKILSTPMGTRKLEGISRCFFSFGDDWGQYINKEPVVLAKQVMDGGVFDDGKQTLIYNKGDYMVEICNDTYKISKKEFEKSHIPFKSSETDRYIALNTILTKIAPTNFSRNTTIKIGFLDKLKILFSRELKVKLTINDFGIFEYSFGEIIPFNLEVI